MQKLLGRGAGEEAKIMHQMRLIAVAGFERDLGQILPCIPKATDMLQASKPAEPLR